MNNSVKEAAELLRSGNLSGAEALLAQLPQDSAVLNLLGVLRNRQGKHPEAIALLERALSLSPGDPRLLVGLGNTHGAMGENDEALRCYEAALSAMPDMAEAHFNKALLYRGGGDYLRAASSFRKAALASPVLFEASQGVVDCLASLVKERGLSGQDHAPIPAPAAKAGCSPVISIVICSIDAEKFRDVKANYSRLLAGYDFEIVGIHDAKSLCEAYNRGFARSRGEVVIFSHDDIEILSPDFASRLIEHLQVCDLVGVAGTDRLTGPLYSWSGHAHSHAWVTQKTRATTQRSTQYRVAIDNLRGTFLLGAQALDGVFFAAKRKVLESVKFDENFDGFHFYDLDFTYTAYKAGFRLGIFGDIVLAHESEGKADAAWYKYAGAFRRKYSDLDGAEQPRHRYAAVFDSKEQVMAFHSFLSGIMEAEQQREIAKEKQLGL